MKHPEFTWWPWGLLSLATPLVAVGAALGYFHSPQSDHNLVMAVLLSALGAGNAYLIAIAGGSLRTAVLAVPVGALTGFCVVWALSCPPFFIAYVMILLVGILGYTIEWLMLRDFNPLVVVGSIILMGIALLFGMGTVAAGFAKESPFAVALAYPFVCACICAAMIVHNRWNGAVEGFVAGFKASIVALPLSLLFSMALFFLIGHGNIIVYGTACLVIYNYFTLKAMFPMLLRVTGAEPAEIKRERKLDRPAETLNPAVDSAPIPAQPASPATP